MIFTPLKNYAGFEHVLNCWPCCAHPNGNVYVMAIAKQGGTRQNMEIHRVHPGSMQHELVHIFTGGGVDAVSQIAAGGCWLYPDGSLQAWASAVPQGAPTMTQTGFVGGYWPRLYHIDEPYSLGSVLFPAVRTAPAWEGRMISGGELVDVPSVFGVPHASRYDIRFVALADAPDVRVRAGVESCPYFVTVNTQYAGRQEHTNGPTPGPHVWVSAVDGAGKPHQAQVWFQICGYG